MYVEITCDASIFNAFCNRYVFSKPNRQYTSAAQYQHYITVGIIVGMLTCQIICMRFAPSMRAASISSGGTLASAAIYIMAPQPISCHTSDHTYTDAKYFPDSRNGMRSRPSNSSKLLTKPLVRPRNISNHLADDDHRYEVRHVCNHLHRLFIPLVCYLVKQQREYYRYRKSHKGIQRYNRRIAHYTPEIRILHKAYEMLKSNPWTCPIYPYLCENP